MLHTAAESDAAAHEVIIFKIWQFRFFYLMNDIIISEFFESVDRFHRVTSCFCSFLQNFSMIVLYIIQKLARFVILLVYLFLILMYNNMIKLQVVWSI